MIALAAFIHYTSIAVCTVFTALGVTLGQGTMNKATFAAIDRQPAIQPAIARTNLLGLALIETSALLGLIISFLLFFKMPVNTNAAIAEIGMAIAISIPGLVIGYVSSMPAYETMNSIARQPFIARKLSNYMLINQSLTQTPLIFGFIIALVIRAKLPHVTTLAQALTLIASGAAIGLGCIGPALGGGHLTKTGCKSIGLNRFAYSKLFTFNFISQAIVETPIIFASVIAFFLTTKALSVPDHAIIGFANIAFAATIGIGTLGPGIGSGRSAAAATLQIAANPQQYTMLSRSSMLAQGLIDTCAIYAFIVSLWLILTPLI